MTHWIGMNSLLQELFTCIPMSLIQTLNAFQGVATYESVGFFFFFF